MANDPFAKLGSIDQRLFQSTKPTATPLSDESVKAHNEEAKKQTHIVRNGGKPSSRHAVLPSSRQAVKETSRHAVLPSSLTNEILSVSFDLNNKVGDHKEDCRLAENESAALARLKLELLLKHDVPTSKQDILRCGFYMLIEDYRSRGELSELIRLLKTKKR